VRARNEQRERKDPHAGTIARTETRRRRAAVKRYGAAVTQEQKKRLTAKVTESAKGREDQSFVGPDRACAGSVRAGSSTGRTADGGVPNWSRNAAANAEPSERRITAEQRRELRERRDLSG
jgi:hypothetical protein